MTRSNNYERVKQHEIVNLSLPEAASKGKESNE